MHIIISPHGHFELTISNYILKSVITIIIITLHIKENYIRDSIEKKTLFFINFIIK